MPKVDFAILKQKKFGLPVWAWALVLALGLYLVYRHSKNAAPAAAAAAAPTDTSGTSSAGDLMSSGTTNAGNATGVDTTVPGEAFPDNKVSTAAHDFIDTVNAAADAARQNDTAQNTDTTATNGTATGADIGLTHIAGDYWWDTVNRKLVKVPGSGGKTKKPNTVKAGGKKAKVPQKKSVIKRVLPHPPQLPKHKTIPKPAAHQVPLTRTQKKAVTRAQGSASGGRPKPPPKKAVAVHRTIRPPVRRPPKRQAIKKRGRG
jgi:hypothetical protein